MNLSGDKSPHEILAKDRYEHFWIFNNNLELLWKVESQTGHGEEVDRHDLTEIVAKERFPGRGWWWSPNALQNTRDGALRYHNAEHLQFAVDSRCPPERVDRRHPQDQSANLGGDAGPSFVVMKVKAE